LLGFPYMFRPFRGHHQVKHVHINASQNLLCLYSPPTRAEVRNTWIYTPTPPYIFME
jgi:hypothetical protein